MGLTARAVLAGTIAFPKDRQAFRVISTGIHPFNRFKVSPIRADTQNMANADEDKFMEVSLQQSLGLTPGTTRKSPTGDGGDSSHGTPLATHSSDGGSEPQLHLAALKQRLLAEPSVDSAKVDRIAGEIRAGTYRIDPQNIAEKMLDLEWSL